MLPALTLITLGCSLNAPDCPGGQFCAADWDPDTQDCPATGRCEPLPTAPDVELWLPIPSGESVYCAKGNLRPTGSHGACSGTGRFALDLATPAFSPPHLVLASADGIAYPFGGCSTDGLDRGHTDRCNLGWGNMVHVEHVPGIYTLYAHLSSLLVRWGQPVRRGQPIGVEGNTGAAGGKHIHWSLHRGDAKEGGVAPSVPIEHLHLVADVVRAASLPCVDWSTDGRVHSETRLISDNALVPTSLEWFVFQAPETPTLGEPTKSESNHALQAAVGVLALCVAGLGWRDWRRFKTRPR
jgi:hypothetical protein